MLQYIVLFVILLANQRVAGRTRLKAANKTGSAFPVRCKVSGNAAYHYHRYVPSEWEQTWYQNRMQLNGAVCGHMVRQATNSQQWLDDVSALLNNDDELDTWGLEHLKPNIWSFFEYVNPCLPESNPKRVLRVPMEPLVGLMRHPFTPDPCVPQGKKMGNPESRDYLLAPKTFKQLYPGRAWLFDLGTQTYKTSIGWFVDRYAAQGIHFDGIFAWEAAGVDHVKYWSEVPAHITPKLHFYNTPVKEDVVSPGQPLNILYQVYKPGDFVVFKLDIDQPALEATVLSAVASDEDVRHMIGEMYFEHHSDAPEMAVFGLGWGQNMVAWHQSIALFHDLRQSGLRLHYWP